MSDLFDFLGCMSLFNGNSSGSPHSRSTHPKRQPPKLRLPADTTSSIPSAALTPHPPSQPYYSRYPITRAPTVREPAAASLPVAQALLPNYPYAVRHVARYNQAPNLASPQTYWKTYGTPAAPAYMTDPSYAARALSETYMAPAVAYPPQPGPISYCVPQSEMDFYPRSILEAESYVEEEDPMWAYRSYPSQFPSAQARVSRARVQQLSYYDRYATGPDSKAREASYLPRTAVHEDAAQSTFGPKEALPSHRLDSATMSCTMGLSAAASPSREAEAIISRHQQGIVAEHSTPADEGSPRQTPNQSSKTSAEKVCEEEIKVVDLERGPLTTMAETSDDAGASDTWSAVQVCASNDPICQHSPEVVGNGNVPHSNIPSECVCQQCRDAEIVAPSQVGQATVKGAEPVSEKVAKSPLEVKGAVKQQLPVFQPVAGVSKRFVSERPAEEPLMSLRVARGTESEKEPEESLVEAGVGTDTIESGPPVSWSSCSSTGPLSSEADSLVQQKQLVLKELVGKQQPGVDLQKQAGDSHRKGEESLVRKRVQEWNGRLSAIAASESPVRSRVYSKRNSGKCKEQITSDETVPDIEEVAQGQGPSARECHDDVNAGAGPLPTVSQSTMSPPTDTHIPSERVGNADDLFRLMKSPDWSQYLESLPTSQKHSPSPTQLPRNPFMASTERSVYMISNLDMSPNVVSRQLDLSMSKHQSALRLSNDSDASKGIQLARQLTAVVARDDLDKQLQHYLRQNGVAYEFVRLKRSYYAVCRPTYDQQKEDFTRLTGGRRSDVSCLSTFDSSVYFGRAQQAVAQLPPTVLCYVVISLDLGRLSVAVLSRSNVLKHFGCEGIRKWLTPQNRFFTQQARRTGLAMDERRRSTGSCAPGTSRRHREELPAGGEYPWRRGQSEPIASFLNFIHRVASEIPKEGNSDPFPTRVPFETAMIMKSYRNQHNRRASS